MIFEKKIKNVNLDSLLDNHSFYVVLNYQYITNQILYSEGH